MVASGSRTMIAGSLSSCIAGLSEFCRERLASYKVPRIWRFVDQFPQTASSKIQKYVLRELYLAEKVR